MITMQEWKVMSHKEQTLWLERNTGLNGRSESKRGLVQGVGINDAPYCTQPRIDGKLGVCPAYRAWASMLERARSNKFHEKHETYKCVSVCEEWHSLMSFRKWWMENQVDGWHVDKDILSDSREYSPETSLFAPAWLNNFTIDCGSARGACPIGADFHKGSGRFRARCRNPVSKKLEHLGYFHTPEEAHLAWRTRKLELALDLKPKMDEIDQRIYPRVVEIINNAR